jgi:ribosomal protein L37E
VQGGAAAANVGLGRRGRTEVQRCRRCGEE